MTQFNLFKTNHPANANGMDFPGYFNQILVGSTKPKLHLLVNNCD